MRHLLLTVSVLICAVIPFAGCSDDADNTERSFAEAMTEEHEGDSPTGNEVAWLEPSQPVSGNQVEYAAISATPVEGFLAKPQREESQGLAGIVVIHEWWGLNDNIRAMTERIAGEGYVALAVDMYEGNVASTPDGALALMQNVQNNQENAVANLEQAVAYLKELGAEKIGVIGWCFGGGWSLRTAFTFPEDIDATVIYYGHLETDPKMLSALDMPVLGIFGEEDGGIPVDLVRTFEATLDSIGVEKSVHIYPGANHAFANPSGERYHAEAAMDAWKKTVAFFAVNLKGEW